MKEKIGYISINFTPETVEKLVNWSDEQIPTGQLFTTKQNGKTDGGNVMHDAHLTLFFGLDDAKLDKDKISEFLSTILLEKLEVETISTFSTQQPGCKIVILKIVDPDNILSSIHNKFLEFSYFPEYQKFIFTPHITIAFVKGDFDTDVLSLSGLPELLVQDIEYKIKND